MKSQAATFSKRPDELVSSIESNDSNENVTIVHDPPAYVMNCQKA
jgi:hypothetical protein